MVAVPRASLTVPGTTMSSRSAQINTPDAIAASNNSLTGDFPVYSCEEPNSKEGDDYWMTMNNILDRHASFGYMERGVPPPVPWWTGVMPPAQTRRS